MKKIFKSATSFTLALIMSVIFGITSFAADLCTVYVKGTIEYDKAFECLTILNKERRAAGLNELTMNPSLMEVAITRAFECNLFFSHDRPNGTSYNTLHDTTTWHGENVASGYKTAAQVMDGWMISPDHKANMLSDKYKSVGIACINGVWVQEFSGRYSQQASKPANCTVVRGISCDASNMYMESPYRYKPASLSVGDRIELLAPKLYLFNQLCYGVDTSSYDVTTSDSSIATVNGLTLTAHNSGIFSVIYTLKGTNISTSVEFSVEGTVEEEKPEPKNISECTFTLSKTEYTYSGKECEPTVVIKDGNKTLAKETDYTVGYEDNIDAGCGKAYITGIGGYSGTKTLFFDIYMRNILDGAELEYYECVADGAPKKPKFITNTTAVEGVDFTIKYSNNVKPGIGIAYIEATNINYYGWGELYFNINEPSNDDSSQNSSGNNESESAKTNISDCIVTLSRTEYTYSGSENKPTPTVKYGSKTLVKGVDFNVCYENNIDAGCASVYITGIGRYEGTKTLLFDIYPKVINFDDVKLEYYECIADGTPKKPKFIFANVNLKEGIDYITSYKNNIKPGIGMAYYETLNPNFVGWAELYFNINIPENENTNQVNEDNSTTVTEETIDIPEAKKTQTISVFKNAKLTYGKTLELFASAKTAISYKSLDTSVAKINSKGIITATGAGTTKILITAAETDEYEKTTAYVNVTVEKAAQKIAVKDSFVKYADSPSFNLGAESKTKLSYKSANTNIATMSSNGTVTIKGSGTVSIKITAAESANYKSASKTVLINVYKNSDNDANVDESNTSENTNTTAKDKLDVEVIIEPYSKTSQFISLPKTSFSKTINSKAFYLNAKAKTKLAYKTSNSKVVTVNSDGKVTIKGIGKATITITAVETSRYEKAVKKVTITVKPSKPKIKDLSSKSNRITIRWDKLDDNITGYQIAYKRVGSESYKCKTYKGSSLTKKTLKGFSGGTYYVKMRSYKVVDGKRIYSGWSTVKKINISF